MLYKFLKADGSPTHGPSTFRWPMPKDGKPGDWVKVEGKLVSCANGLHLVRKSGLLEWANDQLYEAEHRGKTMKKDENVLVCSEARLTRRVETWNMKNLRLFACDCAERALPIFEALCPEDVRRRSRAATWAACRAAARAATWAERQWQIKMLMECLRDKRK